MYSSSAFVFAAFAGQVRAETLVVNSYGVTLREEIIRKAIIEPFEDATGISVVYDAAGFSVRRTHAKIKATKGCIPASMLLLMASQSLQGCRDGVLAKPDSATHSSPSSIFHQGFQLAAGPKRSRT